MATKDDAVFMAEELMSKEKSEEAKVHYSSIWKMAKDLGLKDRGMAYHMTIEILRERKIELVTG